MWAGMKGSMLKAAEEVCGMTKGPPRHKETWWWNEECDRVVKEKRRLFGEMQKLKQGKVDRRRNGEDGWRGEGKGEGGGGGGGEGWRGDKIIFRDEEVREAIRRMKEEKAAGPTGVVAEMFKAMGEDGVRRMTELCNEVVREGRISWMLSKYKGKGDALECGWYRGLKW